MPRDKVYPHDNAETKLINLEFSSIDKIDTYIGSANESYNLEPSPFMNPFDKSRKGCKGAVEHYKPYFFRRFLSEPEFKQAVLDLRGDVLGGWCYPRKCHGEVIIDLLGVYDDTDESMIYEHIKNELDNIDKKELGTKGFAEYNAAREELNKKY